MPHLDTGSLYRAVGLAVLLKGGDPADPLTATAAAQNFHYELLSAPALREARTSQAASAVAVHAGVRAALLERQKAFAARPSGAVLDGRDIGTVICPSARAKLFVTASPEVRAERRRAELASRGEHKSFSEVLADILARDARDAGRELAPTLQAKDAALLDTSDLAIDAAVRRAVELVEARINR